MMPAEIADRLSEYFSTRRPRVTHERELQEDLVSGLAVVLAPTHRALREHPLSRGERPDFFVVEASPPPCCERDTDGDGHCDRHPDVGVVIEVKVAGSTAEVTRQLWRYTKHNRVSGVLLVTTRHRHRVQPSTLDQKPIAVLYLGDFLL